MWEDFGSSNECGVFMGHLEVAGGFLLSPEGTADYGNVTNPATENQNLDYAAADVPNVNPTDSVQMLEQAPWSFFDQRARPEGRERTRFSEFPA